MDPVLKVDKKVMGNPTFNFGETTGLVLGMEKTSPGREKS